MLRRNIGYLFWRLLCTTGYDVHEDGSGVIVEGVRDFDLVHTFECGQCFRWYREPDGSYTGVVRGRVANVSYSPGVLKLDNVTIEDFRQVWFDYFDLGRDYGLIKKAVTTDGIMERAVESGSGIRILRQEPWETLVSFIISANNRIPRIMKIISEISRLFGTEIKYAGKSYYGFRCTDPCFISIEQVSNAGRLQVRLYT